MTRILISGGAGYVGSVLIDEMLRACIGDKITVVDRFLHGENSLATVCQYQYLDIQNIDCRDPYLMRPLIISHDVILPLAAIVGAPACAADPQACWSTNREAVEMICNYASLSQRIIYPNTNSGYGTTGDEPCTEDTPLKPISAYGRSKCAAEDAVLRRENSIALRLATAFGASPRMRLDLLVNDFVWRAVKDRAVVLFEAHARRNFVHVRDIARAFIHCLDNFDAMRGRAYNVGDSRVNLTKAALCEEIAQHVPLDWHDGEGEDPDKRDYLVSNARIEATGWSPSVTLDEGIKELVKLYHGLRPLRYANA